MVIFNSFSWVPGSNEQCEDRSFRIGQNEDVNIYYQLFEDTVSVRMLEALKNKKEIIEAIIGGKQLSEEEIIELTMNKLFEDEI